MATENEVLKIIKEIGTTQPFIFSETILSRLNITQQALNVHYRNLIDKGIITVKNTDGSFCELMKY